MANCGSIALDIKTYFAGQNQPTHPNVIAFEQPWHGYLYYMAYTPYPYACGFEENPCIAASNDLIHWEKPTGAVSPIATSEELNCDELKDSHLLYRKDLDQLEIWFLGRLNGTRDDGAPLLCIRKTSSDGRTWSAYEIMYTFYDFQLISPSVIYNEEYLFWGIHHTQADTALYFMRSKNGSNWSTPQKCTIPNTAATDMWHGTVINALGQYHFTWVGYSGKSQNQIYYSSSTNGFQFTAPQVIVENDVKWKYLYRPCLINIQDIWYCYYGVIRLDGKWLISMSHGESLTHLNGITRSELGSLCQSNDALIAHSLKMQLKQCFKDIFALITPSFMLLIPFLFILRTSFLSPLGAWLVSIFLCVTASSVILKCSRPLKQGFIMGTINACATAFLTEIAAQIAHFIMTV